MKRYKIVLIAVVYSLTVLSITACNSAKSNASGNTREITPLMVYNPKITMTTGKGISSDDTYPAGEDSQNNVVYNLMESEIGIKYVNKFTVPGSGYHEKLKMAISSNNLPDLIWCNATELQTMVAADQVTDLTTLYKQYATDSLKSLLGYKDGLAFESATFDGKVYAMPSISDAGNNVPLMYVRSDWMKKLGFTAPKSMEDVFKMATAFAQKDPDGNGKNDTIGIAFSDELYPVLCHIANAFNLYPHMFVKDSNGKLTYGSLNTGLKTVLSDLNQLYRNGAISKEFGSKDSAEVAKDVAAGDVGIYFGQFFSPLWPLDDTIKNVNGADWVCYSVPGSNGGDCVPYSPVNTNDYYAVRKGYENPEALIITMNHWAEQYNSHPASNFAVKWNETIQSDKYRDLSIHNWSPVILDKPTKNMEYAEHISAAYKSGDDSSLTPYEKNILSVINNKKDGYWSWKEIYTDSVLRLKEYKSLKYSAYNGPLTDSQKNKGPLLEQDEVSTFISIIMGEEPIDEFDSFVERWYRLGGQSILDEVNKAVAK